MPVYETPRCGARPRSTLVGAVLVALACVPGALAVQPPWLRARPVPAEGGDAPVVLAQWRVADNRADCAPLMFNSVRLQREVPVARGAYFGGGWGVAYDTPTVRSAFGIAGAGVVADDADLRIWKRSIHWSDGSGVAYGLVGHQGPGYLAYLHVTGQECLYNVWSNLGRVHLRSLLRQLRVVETVPTRSRS